MADFLVRCRMKYRRITNRCPRQLRVLGGPLLGGLIGLLALGIAGLFIGFLLGYLLRELFVQSFRDRSVFHYFEEPGLQQFYEAEPGLAAWCALAVLVAVEGEGDLSAGSSAANRSMGGLPQTSGPAVLGSGAEERILKEVILVASCVFTEPLVDPFLIEHFSRLAISRRKILNPALLAESLKARRISMRNSRGNVFGGDENLRSLGRVLRILAKGDKAENLVREIRLILDPASKDEQEAEKSGDGGIFPADPWKILGLPPGTPVNEVKAHYRRLAKLFHPDELEVLDEEHRETAARAFIAINEAYREIVGS